MNAREESANMHMRMLSLQHMNAGCKHAPLGLALYCAGGELYHMVSMSTCKAGLSSLNISWMKK